LTAERSAAQYRHGCGCCVGLWENLINCTLEHLQGILSGILYVKRGHCTALGPCSTHHMTPTSSCVLIGHLYEIFASGDAIKMGTVWSCALPSRKRLGFREFCRVFASLKGLRVVSSCAGLCGLSPLVLASLPVCTLHWNSWMVCFFICLQCYVITIALAGMKG